MAHHTPDGIRRLQLAKEGKRNSPETRRRISESNTAIPIQTIIATWEECDRNASEASRQLGMPRNYVARRLKRAGISAGAG